MVYTTNWFISGVPATVDYSAATVTGGPFYDRTGYITSLYGWRGRICAVCGYPEQTTWSGHGWPFTHNFVDLGVGDTHHGLDMTIFPVQSGVYDIRTLFQGTVLVVDGVNDANGLSVGVLSDDGQWYAEFLHLSEVAGDIYVGRHIGTGHVLGKMGTTGYSTGPHLHLGLMYQWQYVDPLPVLMSMRNIGELIHGSQYWDVDPWFHDEYGYY